MIVKIKCFVCDGLTLDDQECRICEGQGQIESLLKLSVEDLKIWAERLQKQQQELVNLMRLHTSLRSHGLHFFVGLRKKRSSKM